jgi:ABC-type phosphate transport system substrate-binding protein
MRRTLRLGLAGVGTCALVLGAAAPAFADYAPSSKDTVGVGSDTVQNIADFAADGDPFGDGSGYNGIGNKYKLVSFDATADANDRAAYLNGSNNTTLAPLNPTIVLRQGSVPVQRPNGSSAGIAALLADTATPHKINFVRASRALKATEEAQYHTATGDVLDTVKISDDPLEIAHSIAGANPVNSTPNPNSNIPAAGLTTAQLVNIYSCSSSARLWTQVGGTSATDIIPLIPQAGSGTRSTFLADLQAANGGTAITLGGCVETVEENDPGSIALAAEPPLALAGATTPANGTVDPADAIVPFSAGRLELYTGGNGNPGYFHDPSTAFPGTTSPLSPGIALSAGTGVAAGNIYDDVRGLFIIFRNSDLSDAGWQPGSTLNWAEALFWGSGSYYGQGLADPFTEAAGGTPDYFQEPTGYAPN